MSLALTRGHDRLLRRSTAKLQECCFSVLGTNLVWIRRLALCLHLLFRHLLMNFSISLHIFLCFWQRIMSPFVLLVFFFIFLVWRWENLSFMGMVSSSFAFFFFFFPTSWKGILHVTKIIQLCYCVQYTTIGYNIELLVFSIQTEVNGWLLKI